MAVQPTHRLVERAVAVVVLAALDVALRTKPGTVTIKPVSTILVGATPEFEIAALSLAFLCGEQEGDNRMELGRERIKIVCYPHDGKGGPKVASAYIELA